MELPRDRLVLVPLGGAEQIGMNLNLYGLNGKWLMVDLGISFGDDSLPGVNVIMPDPTFIADRRDDLVGLVLTHAHEDHLGAVPYLWPRLRCPVYATPFAAAFLRAKLAEHDLLGQVPIHEIQLGGRFTCGPFDLEFVTVTHSILEPNAVAIRTAAGTVLHTGDWKLDPDPRIGETADEARLRALGEEGVDALVCDSTNVFLPGSAGSEADVATALSEVIGAHAGKRIAVACFATNVARLSSIIEAAHAHGRCVGLVGRSLYRVVEAARSCGYLTEYPNLLTDREVMEVPRDQVLMICTGSQGEPRSALARIARRDHPVVSLSAGDVVVFSAREIPGNEKGIARMQNALVSQGVTLVTAHDAPIHVSGHPGREELARMYELTRPRIVVPVHGEPRHTRAQAELARRCQVPETVVPHDGAVIELTPGGAGVIDQVPSGVLCLDGNSLIPTQGEVLRARMRMIWNGVVFVTVALTPDGELIGQPQLSAPSLLDPAIDVDLLADLAERIAVRIDDLDDDEVLEDEAVTLAVRQAVRRPLRQRFAKRPLIEVHLVRTLDRA